MWWCGFIRPRQHHRSNDRSPTQTGRSSRLLHRHGRCRRWRVRHPYAPRGSSRRSPTVRSAPGRRHARGRWVDRLGRNYADVCDILREFMRRGVVIRTVINGLTFDGATTDPMQQAVRDALIAFMAATAQAQAEAAKEAQKAGIEHAKAKGEYLGRKPSYTGPQYQAVLDLLAQGAGIRCSSEEPLKVANVIEYQPALIIMHWMHWPNRGGRWT